MPLHDIPFVWPHIEGYVAKSLKIDTCERYWPVDVFDLLLKGQARLWVAYDKDAGGFLGMCVTEIMIWPRMRECRTWLVGGKKLRLWQDEMREMIEAFARGNECRWVTGAGRTGWAKMPGYKVDTPNLVRDLGHE